MSKYLKAPKIINIELTTVCPYNCCQCYKKNASYTDSIMDIQKLEDILEEAHRIGTGKVLFSGGEPLTYPYLEQALLSAKRNKLTAYISTGGFGIDSNMIQKLKMLELDILYVSLNGSTGEINRTSREGYDCAVNAIELSQKYGLKTRINWVARKDNVDDLKNILTLARQKGVEGIDILKNKPNAAGIIDSRLGYQGLMKIKKVCHEHGGQLNIGIESCFFELRNIVGINIKNEILRGCSGGKYSLSISSTGIISPCSHAVNEYGVKDTSIMDYWCRSEILNLFREKSNKNSQCTECVYNEFCDPCKIDFLSKECAEEIT